MGWTVYNSDGKILQSAELADGAVTFAKLATSSITGAPDLGEAPATGDSLLVSDTSASAALKEITVANLFDTPTLTSPVLNTGVSGSAVLDDDTLGGGSSSNTKVATQQSIKAYVDAQVTAQDLDITDGSATIAIDLDNEVLTITSGEGIDATVSGNTLTIAGEEASSSNKGVASFSTDNFSVSSGVVTIKNDGVTVDEIYTSAGTAGSGTFLRGDGQWQAAGGSNSFTNDVTVTSGNFVIGTAGKGIDFAIQTATSTGTTTAEILDHYEEGTWTPAIADNNLSPLNNGTQSAFYCKIGQVVTVTIDIRPANISGLTGGNSIRIVGLPFTSNNTNVQALSCARGSGLAITAGTNLVPGIAANTTNMKLYLWDAADGTNELTVTQFSSDGSLIIAGSYIAST